MPVEINYEKCCWKDGKCTSCECGGACVGCVEACPVNALERKMNVEYNPEICTDCGACVSACEYKAISLL
jgi:NAD-dependent dihydropyrimidine dehydrogenase PreA subunit